MGCCALAACVDLTPPREKQPDAIRPEGTSDSGPPSSEPDAGAGGNAGSDRPAPTPDAEEPTPAIDAPRAEDAAASKDSSSPDGGRDGAAERTSQGDVRSDGDRTTDGAGKAETPADTRAESEEVGEPDAPIEVDAGEITMDSAPDLADTSSPDADTFRVVKLAGTAFGTGPAFSSHPSATYDKVFDGDPTTFFDDSTTDGGYAGIDLGSSTVVSLLRYYPRADYNERMVGGKFQCSASSQTDGYLDLFSITAVPPLAWTTVPLTAAPACRYFRYLGPTGGHTNTGEIEFWAKGESEGGDGGTTTASFGAPLVNLALGRPASASSEQTYAGKPAANGNDGVVSTMFCPASPAFPVWYQVDLGDVYPIEQTGITFESVSTEYQYQIDVSVDGSQWTTGVTRLTGVGNGHSTIADIFQAKARHVRVTFTGTSDGRWGCVKELMVWGHTVASLGSAAAR